jgi:hypothetical protein
MVVPKRSPHKLIMRGDANMKQLNFPPDVDLFVHEMCAKVIKRAIENGTYKPKEQKASGE